MDIKTKGMLRCTVLVKIQDSMKRMEFMKDHP